MRSVHTVCAADLGTGCCCREYSVQERTDHSSIHSHAGGNRQTDRQTDRQTQLTGSVSIHTSGSNTILNPYEDGSERLRERGEGSSK